MNTLHYRFEQQVTKTPLMTALVGGEKTFTYQELNNRANQFARFLCDAVKTKEAIIAIMLDNSADTVITIYGVLKAGMAYLPIDPAAPTDRIHYAVRLRRELPDC
jgi:surfactin family lipopeptide synthetase A